MELSDLINKRIQELVTITNFISNTQEDFKKQVDEILAKIKASGNTEEDKIENIVRIKKIKELNSSEMLKVNEVGINVRVLNELYSLQVIVGNSVNLPEKDIEILDYNLKNVKPTFILDKNEVVFYSPEVADFIKTSIANADENYDEIIANIKK